MSVLLNQVIPSGRATRASMTKKDKEFIEKIVKMLKMW